MSVGKLLNVDEAAKRIGVTPGRVRQWLRSGELKGIKANQRAWLVHSSDADKMKETKPATGRPRISQL